MNKLYYIIFFVGISVLAIAGIVWYLRSSGPESPRYNPFANSQGVAEETLYDPPSVFMPANGYTTPTYAEEPASEMIPLTLPPGLQ